MAVRATTAAMLDGAQRLRTCRQSHYRRRCRPIRWDQRCSAIGWTQNHGGYSGVIADRCSLIQREERVDDADDERQDGGYDKHEECR